MLTLAATAAALTGLTGRASAAYEPIRRVGGPLLRPALNAYSFLEQLNDGRIDLPRVCEFAAKQNIEAVDLTGYFFPGYPKAPADAYVNQLKRQVHDLGLVISGTGVRNDFATADKAVRAEGVNVTKTWIEVAARLGAPVVRVFAGPQAPFKKWEDAAANTPRADVEGWMADALRQCAEHGEKFGVIVAVQNHGDFISSGAEHLSLLKRVDHPWCGPLVDTGKYFTDDPYADIAVVAPYAVNWQIKENMRSDTKSPPTDFRKLVKIIRDSGYRGYLPIETLAMKRKDYDPAAEVIKTLAALREAIAATEAKS
jgi:sugar phosphate isomerase/epimerase